MISLRRPAFSSMRMCWFTTLHPTPYSAPRALACLRASNGTSCARTRGEIQGIGVADLIGIAEQTEYLGAVPAVLIDPPGNQADQRAGVPIIDRAARCPIDHVRQIGVGLVEIA